MKNKTSDFEAKVMAALIVVCFVLLGLIEEVPV